MRGRWRSTSQPRDGSPQRRHRPQQPGAAAQGHEPVGGGRAADARALAIDEQLRDGHPNVASDLNNLAQLLQATNRLAEAEPLMRRALAIDEQSLRTGSPQCRQRLNNLARCSRPRTGWRRPSR